MIFVLLLEENIDISNFSLISEFNDAGMCCFMLDFRSIISTQPLELLNCRVSSSLNRDYEISNVNKSYHGSNFSDRCIFKKTWKNVFQCP